MEECGARPPAAAPVVVLQPYACTSEVPPRSVINNRVISSRHDERHHAAYWIKVWHEIAIAPVEQGHALFLSSFRPDTTTFDVCVLNSPHPIFHSKSG